MPVVGSHAIVTGSVGANPSLMSWDDLRESLAKGWGVSNHSDSHRGRTFGNPPELLTPDQIREELFWSQAISSGSSALFRAPSLAATVASPPRRAEIPS